MSINYQDDWSIRESFSGDLIDGETVIWSGQPDSSVIFSKADIFMIPFSLLWGGFAIFWELGVLGNLSRHQGGAGNGPGIFFVLWGIPFVLIGLYMIFGRFFYKTWKKKHTFYAVTNLRVLILTNTFSKNLQALFLKDIPVIQKSVGKNGIGTITFGNQNAMAGFYSNTGMYGGGYQAQVPSFDDIQDVDTVYELVNRARSPQEKSL